MGLVFEKASSVDNLATLFAALGAACSGEAALGDVCDEAGGEEDV